MSQQQSSPGAAPLSPAAHRYVGPAEGAPSAASLPSSTCTRCCIVDDDPATASSLARSLSLSSTCAHTRPGSGTANLSRETWERRAAGNPLRTISLTTEPASLPRPYLYCIRADAARAHPYRTGGAGATSIASGRRTRPPCPEDPRAWCATACATRPRTGPGGR